MSFGIVPKSIMLDGKLSAQAKALYAIVSTFADREGRAHLSRETLGAALGKSTRSVSAYCQELESRGYLARTIQEGQVTVYHLLKHASTLATLFKGKKTTPETGVKGTPEGDCKGTPEKGFKGAEDFKGTPATSFKGTLETGFPLNRTSKKEEERERARTREKEPSVEIPEGWTQESLPILGAWSQWQGGVPSQPFQRTIHLLMMPRGTVLGARVPGEQKLFHGFTAEEIITGIEEMSVSGHHSPSSLIKHTAGLMPAQRGRRHGSTNRSTLAEPEQPATIDSYQQRVDELVARRGGDAADADP